MENYHEPINQLSLEKPRGYNSWRKQITKVVDQLALEAHLKYLTKELVDAYKLTGIILVGSVPLRVLELESKTLTEETKPKYNSMIEAYIKQAGAKRFVLLMNSLDGTLRELVGDCDSAKDILAFVDRRFKTVKITNLEETCRAFNSLFLQDATKYELFLDDLAITK